MLRVETAVRIVPGFGVRYRVTERTWCLFGLPVWRVRMTERVPA